MDFSLSRARLAMVAALISGPGTAAAVAQSTPWTAGAGVEAQTFSFTEGGQAGVESLTLITIPVAANVAAGYLNLFEPFWALGLLESARSMVWEAISICVIAALIAYMNSKGLFSGNVAAAGIFSICLLGLRLGAAGRAAPQRFTETEGLQGHDQRQLQGCL